MQIFKLITSKLFCLLCFLIGIIWFLMLSQFELNQRTYMSENALLVGLIKQQFKNHSAINHFYKEISSLSKKGNSDDTIKWLRDAMENMGLDSDIHNFTFKYDKLLNNQTFDGQNVYGILRSPGAARMQAILITCPLRHGGGDRPAENAPLLASISMMLALAQHSRNKLYWATDIIFLFTEMEYIGLKAWLNAYHGLTDTAEYIAYDPLMSRSGSILAGFNMEIATMNIPYLEFRVESLNGQLPNLDLYNTVVRLAQGMEIPVRIHGVTPPISESLISRQNGLKSFLSMMWHQSSGSPNGLHGLLADFQIPSLTIFSPLESRLNPKTNLFDVTKLMESTLRSLNGLQERMHQSFFFYLLPSSLRYVSIGMYMLPFGLMCGGALLLQVIGTIRHFQLKLQETDKLNAESTDKESKVSKPEISVFDWWSLGMVTIISTGVGFFTNWCLDHILINSYKFKIEPSNGILFGAVSISIALMIVCKLKVANPTHDSIYLLKAGLQLGLGLFLGTLSVLNISMAFMFAIVVVPAALFIYPYQNCIGRFFCKVYLILICPLALIYISAVIHNLYFSTTKVRWNSLDLYKTAITSTRSWIIQGWMERDVLGSWTVNIFTLCYLPIWVMMWCIVSISPAI